MSRIISFIALVAALLLVGGVFYYVMIPFFLPLFMALLLVVIFQPMQRWMVVRCGGRRRVAAALTTLAVVLIAVVPLGLVVAKGVSEGVRIYRSSMPARSSDHVHVGSPAAPPVSTRQGQSHAGVLLHPHVLAQTLAEFGNRLGLPLEADRLESAVHDYLAEWIGPVAVNAAKFTLSLLVGLAIMSLSLYYFLADGPMMLRTVVKFSPLDPQHLERLTDEFTNITRAVVVATLAAAVAQGLTAGLGFLMAGVPTVFLLTIITTVLALVPFVGAAAVWVPVCLWLFFVERHYVAGTLLAIYCATVVSSIDNVVKPLVLHGRSNIHPLLALLSVLGGVQALGPIGIFIGPMVVTFLHALLEIFQTELGRLKEQEPGGGPTRAAAGGG